MSTLCSLDRLRKLSCGAGGCDGCSRFELPQVSLETPQDCLKIAFSCLEMASSHVNRISSGRKISSRRSQDGLQLHQVGIKLCPVGLKSPQLASTGSSWAAFMQAQQLELNFPYMYHMGGIRGGLPQGSPGARGVLSNILISP